MKTLTDVTPRADLIKIILSLIAESETADDALDADALFRKSLSNIRLRQELAGRSGRIGRRFVVVRRNRRAAF